MDMAKKASRLVFEPPHELKLEIDALLLPADQKFDHSSPRKILAVQPLSEGQKTAKSSRSTVQQSLSVW